MRIVGGEWGGLTLVTPKGNATRPSSDRLRESLFNILTHSMGHPLGNCVDLFAGCGSLGIEALSRGGTSCIFFEEEKHALTALEKNLQRLDLSSKHTEIYSDSRLERWPGLLRKAMSSLGKIETLFMDPPYRKNLVSKVLHKLTLAPDLFIPGQSLVIAEEAKGAEPPKWDKLKEWELVEARDIGDSTLFFCRYR